MSRADSKQSESVDVVPVWELASKTVMERQTAAYIGLYRRSITFAAAD